MHSLRRSVFNVLGALFVLSATTFVVDASTVSADASSVATCHAQNISVRVGATSRGVGGERVIHVFFTNHGPTCSLPLGGPVVEGVRNTLGGRVTASTQYSAPSFPDNESRYVIKKGSQGEDNFVIAVYAHSLMSSPRCDARTASGFDIQNFAEPQSASRYFARTLNSVCFYRGTSTRVTNIAMQWVGTSS